MSLKILTGLLITYLISGCKQSNSNEENDTPLVEENQDAGTIHVQLIDTPEFDEKIKIKGGPMVGRVEYLVFCNGLEKKRFNFDELKESKNANYTTHANEVMLRRYVNFFDFQDFLVHKGDSIVMSFDANKPVEIKYSTFKYSPQDFSVETILNKDNEDVYSTIGLTNDTRMAAFKHFYDDPNERIEQRKRSPINKSKYLENLEIEVSEDLRQPMAKSKLIAQRMLDSLYDNKLISNNVHEFYSNKYANLLLKLDIRSGALDSTTAANKINELLHRQKFDDDYTDQCLESFRKTHFVSKAMWVVSDQYGHQDPKETFDLVRSSKLLSPEVKDRLLFTSLSFINEFFHEDIETYLNLFTEISSNEQLVEKARAKYQQDVLLSSNPSDLHLQSVDKNQLTIEKLLQDRTGKILYVDFWASWCAPCIAEMKFSKKLNEQYKERQDFEILYLSMDDNYVNWNKASMKYGLNDSFRILASENSDFIKEHKVSSIPRYMIIDKSGKVINNAAPRPSDPKIRGMLDKLLAK